MFEVSARTRSCAVLLAFLCVAVAAAGPVMAQGAASSISGVVRVPSFLRGDRVEPDVVVQLIDAGGQVRSATTDSAGTFAFGNLPPGRYILLVELPQFARFQQEVMVGPVAAQPVTIGLQYKTSANTPDFVPIRDRWRIDFPEWQRYAPDLPGEYPFRPRGTLNPYRQNALKGDLPIIGQSVFFALTATAELPVEYRTLPTPSGISAEEPGSDAFFGRPEQMAFLPTGIVSAELFHGDTAFRPKDWAIKVTPVFNVNRVDVRERRVLNVSPDEESVRQRHDFALQDAYAEVKLFDVGANFDFVSIRAGIQPFTSDFRGFLFRDSNLGVRLFGTWGRNRNQWNVAWFDPLEKETNSGLNTFDRRPQMVVVANYYRQDFIARGYTISPSFHANLDRDDGFTFDANGFLVRPSPVGLITPHRVTAYYAGLGGDGHWGRLNLTHQFYQAFGRDDANGIAGRRVDVNARFAAVEASVDRDWLRPRVSVVWSSGDDNPEDGTARGFDAIVDNPNIVGGGFSFWNRQGIRLAQTGVLLVGRNSVLPSLRSSKIEGQANFVNPGLTLYNAGIDAELTPKLRTTVNVTLSQFQSTAALRRILFQDAIAKDIGIDYSVGMQYRPWLNENAVVSGGVSAFAPREGFRQMLSGSLLYSPFIMLTLTY
jgi:hypothetical protein